MITNLIPLELLDRGEWAEVAEVEGDSTLRTRMAELGLRPGTRLRMLQPGCPCLFQIGECRLSLRLQDSLQVLVRPLLNGVSAQVAHAAQSEV